MKPATFKVNGHTLAVGDRVSAEVTWQNGKRTTMEGTLITVVDKEVFIQSSVGPVSGDADTVEPI